MHFQHTSVHAASMSSSLSSPLSLSPPVFHLFFTCPPNHRPPASPPPLHLSVSLAPHPSLPSLLIAPCSPDFTLSSSPLLSPQIDLLILPFLLSELPGSPFFSSSCLHCSCLSLASSAHPATGTFIILFYSVNKAAVSPKKTILFLRRNYNY